MDDMPEITRKDDMEKTPTITLKCGDCLELMKELPDKSVDTIITDPPYGMNFQSNRSKVGHRHRKIIGDDNVDGRWVYESYRIAKDGGALLMFCDWKNSCEWRWTLEDSGFKVVSQVIWNREHHGMGDLTGSFAPMHDVIWYATKGRRTFKNGRPKSVISYKRPSPSEDNGHPTCKPLDLMKYFVYKIAEGNVLDPFMGSGTTGVACKRLGRDFIGFELDPTYFEIAKNRIESVLL
jgi:site-specific DNA-methyltransferase (adenine-specific)